MDILQTLLDAKSEIETLRRRNEILSAKVEVMENFMCVLRTYPAQHVQVASRDIAYDLQKHADRIKSEQIPAASEEISPA